VSSCVERKNLFTIFVRDRKSHPTPINFLMKLVFWIDFKEAQNVFIITDKAKAKGGGR
jgi:hypothetical protein